MKRSTYGLPVVLFIAALCLFSPRESRAAGEFPEGCTWGGAYILDNIAAGDGGELHGPAPIGSSIRVVFGFSTPAGYNGAVCAFSGGQAAITDPQGNFIAVAGFDDTPSLPMIYRELGTDEQRPGPEAIYNILSPPIEVRCEDVYLESPEGCEQSGVECTPKPRIKGKRAFGGGNTIAGVTLEESLFYSQDPPMPGGPGASGTWVMDVDTNSYLTSCAGTQSQPTATPPRKQRGPKARKARR
jgi:hypothetical protein